MTGDGAIPVSPKPKSFAGHGCPGHKVASSTASMLRAPTPGGCSENVPTPVFDVLTTIIKAHAAESGRACPDPTGRIDALSNIAYPRDTRRTDVATRRWRAPQLNVSIVGLIAVIGSVFSASEAGKEQPRAVAADQAFQARSVASGSANANAEPLQAREPDSSPTAGVEKERIDGGGVGGKSTSGADSNDQVIMTPVVGHPIKKLVSDTEIRADGAAGERLPSEVVRTDPVPAAAKASAEEPSRRDVVSSPPLAPKLGTSIDRINDPVATQIGRVVSGVNMRAGPSNGQQVVATIPRGSSVDVIKCRHWCEVIFAGQRGWVYKTFVRAPLADVAAPPNRTKSSTRKVASKSGDLRGTRTWASVPNRLKPGKIRRSAHQSTREARVRNQSSSGRPIFLGAIEALWNQIRPTALWPNSD
jgi:SH3-like domain-containing protein